MILNRKGFVTILLVIAIVSTALGIIGAVLLYMGSIVTGSIGFGASVAGFIIGYFGLIRVNRMDYDNRKRAFENAQIA